MILTSYTIYGLLDPHTSEVKYVGVTTGPLCRRVTKHISRAQSHNCALSKWLQKLRLEEVRPEAVTLEMVPFASEGDGHEAEKFWIEYLLSLGAELVNKAHNKTARKGKPTSTRTDAPSRPRKWQRQIAAERLRQILLEQGRIA